MLCYKTSGYIASKYGSGYKKEYGIATKFFCCCMVDSVVAIKVRQGDALGTPRSAYALGGGVPPRLRGRRRDRRAEVTSGGEEDRRPAGGGRWWKRTSGRRAEVFGGGKERRAAGACRRRADQRRRGERDGEGTSGGGCMRIALRETE